jgi:phosphatidylglycerol:prolipoprotein diacylglycerol transferase
VHPVLFEIGPLTAHSYGFFIFLGVVAGLLVSRRELGPLGWDPAYATDVTLIGIVTGILGGKLVYLLTVPPAEIARQPVLHLSLRTGLVWYGVVGAVILSTSLYARWRGVPALTCLDVGVIGLTLGHAFGRVGCFLAGCCHGTETDLPWAVVFTDPRSAAPLGVPLHPTQLYLAGHALAVFGLLWWLRRRKRYEGELLLAFLLSYAFGRLVLEEFRGDALRGEVAGWSTSQVLSLTAVLAGTILFVALRRRQRAAVS